MSASMTDKVAVITGSARGIGRAYAEILLENGIRVCISDIQVDLGRSTTTELQEKFGTDNVTFQECNVTSDGQLEALFKKARQVFGRLDIVINNAGIVCENKLRDMVAINLTAVIEGTMSAIALMGTENGGKGGLVVNTASIAGNPYEKTMIATTGLLCVDVIPQYCATKHGVLGFTRAMGALSQKVNGVRINCICPTFTDTELIKFDPESVRQGQLYGPDVDPRLQLGIDQCGTDLITVRDVACCLMEIVRNDVSGQVMVAGPRGCGFATKLPRDLGDVMELIPHTI